MIIDEDLSQLDWRWSPVDPLEQLQTSRPSASLRALFESGQPGRLVFDTAYGDRGFDRCNPRNFREPTGQETLELVHIKYGHPEQVIEASRHQPAIDHLRAISSFRFERYQSVINLAVKPDRNEHIKAESHLCLIDTCTVASDVPILFKLLDPPRTRRGRQAYSFA